MMRFSGVSSSATKSVVSRAIRPPRFIRAVFQTRLDEREAGDFPHLHLERDEEVEQPQAVVHLRRPGGFHVRRDEGAEGLRMEVALALQELEALALEDVDLGRFALAGDADVAEAAEDAPALEPAQQFRGMVEGEARGPGELSDGQEAVALDGQEAGHGAVGEGEDLPAFHRGPPAPGRI